MSSIAGVSLIKLSLTEQVFLLLRQSVFHCWDKGMEWNRELQVGYSYTAAMVETPMLAAVLLFYCSTCFLICSKTL
jgi:hypothetical protein